MRQFLKSVGVFLAAVLGVIFLAAGIFATGALPVLAQDKGGVADAVTAVPVIPVNLQAADVFPGNVDQYYEFSFDVKNPLVPLFGTFLDRFFHNNRNWNPYKNAFYAQSSNKIEDMKKAIFTKKATFAIKSGDMPAMYFTFVLDADHFDQYVQLLGADQNKISYRGFTLYQNTQGDLYFTNLGTLIIHTEAAEVLKGLVDQFLDRTAPTLAMSSRYQALKPRFLEGSFLNMYFNTAAFAQTNDSADASFLAEEFPALGYLVNAESEFAHVLNGEGLSLAQTANGFQFQFMVQGDKTKMDQINFAFDRYNFVPELYQYLSGKDLIYYQEQSNFQQRFNDTWKILAASTQLAEFYQQVKQSVQQELSIDLDHDLLPLFASKHAFFVHKTNQFLPALTLVTDVKNNPAAAGVVVTKLADYLKKKIEDFQKDNGAQFFQSSTTTVGGGNSQLFTFDFGKTTDFGMAPFPADMLKITLRMGVTQDGFLIVSTHPDLESLWMKNAQKGLTDNAQFNAAFINRTQPLSSFSFLSFTGLHDYLVSLVNNIVDAPSMVKDTIDGIFLPLHDLSAKVTADAVSSTTSGFINVDSEKLLNSFSDIQSGFPGVPFLDAFTSEFSSSSFEQPLSFCDVEESDWFYAAVEKLSGMDVVHGFDDGCFRPAEAMTRSQFVKVLMNSHFADLNYDESKPYFSDLVGDYTVCGCVKFAAEIGVIHGDNGKFYPDRPVTRAEAVQVLQAVSKRSQELYGLPDVLSVPDDALSALPFADVQLSQWFASAVEAAYSHQLVSGVGGLMVGGKPLFMPNKVLTRAEGVKIIKLFNDLYN